MAGVGGAVVELGASFLLSAIKLYFLMSFCLLLHHVDYMGCSKVNRVNYVNTDFRFLLRLKNIIL